MSDKKPLEPLIPIDKLKGVVSKLLTVSKDEIEKAEAERPKRAKRKAAQPTNSP
jgi:hypothetical protein